MIRQLSEVGGGTLNQKWVIQEGSTAMLVLSRKIGEKVVIGDGIVLVVKRILGQRVTFGIEAPEEVRIVRGELPRFDEAPEKKIPGPKRMRNELWTARPR
jgi:carbon storage regulator